MVIIYIENENRLIPQHAFRRRQAHHLLAVCSTCLKVPNRSVQRKHCILQSLSKIPNPIRPKLVLDGNSGLEAGIPEIRNVRPS